MTTNNSTKMKQLLTALKKIELTDDDDFLSVVNNTVQVVLITKTVKKPKDPANKKAPSLWNLFLKEKMQDEDIKKLHHKERMKAIGQMWQEQKVSQ